MPSKINVSTHKFWNKTAMIVGLYLIVEGFLSIYLVPSETLIGKLSRIIRILIGTGIVIANGWFLMNV